MNERPYDPWGLEDTVKSPTGSGGFRVTNSSNRENATLDMAARKQPLPVRPDQLPTITNGTAGM